MAYNYTLEIANDIVNFLSECEPDQLIEFATDEDTLSDALWAEDSVTGNASGSYFYNGTEAYGAISENLDLVAEAFEEFGEYERLGKLVCEQDFETIDVMVRCHLLEDVISEFKDDINSTIIHLLLNASTDYIKTPRGSFTLLPDEYREELDDDVLWDMGFSTHFTHEGFKIMAGHRIGFAVKSE